MTDSLYPLTFVPVYRDYLWGGNRIPNLYRRPFSGPICAESWEIADRPEGMSVVAAGPSRGRTLRDLIEQTGPALLGTEVRGGRFPLLVKIIDAREKLSVQVHPNDRDAKAFGGEAKTEMWYALPGMDGSYVYAGLRPGVDRAAFLDALRRERLEETLCRIPLKAEEGIFIPGGRVHAIGEGCLLLEVQQNSDTTYRVYDWGRKSADGRPRPLHLEQALRVINWDDASPGKTVPRREESAEGHSVDAILTCPHFQVERLAITGRADFGNDGRSFHALFIADGIVCLATDGFDADLHAGTSVLVPAAVRQYRLSASAAPAEVLRISVPPR